MIRWVVATVQGILIKRREQQLTTVASEILRCKANTPPVRSLI